MQWICEQSKTSKIHKQNTTILCCIYGSALTSSDLHHHQNLEPIFPHIQAMTIEISGNNYGKFGVYKLTEFGTRQLGSCFKKPFKEHFACQKVEFYTEVDSSDYTFADFELLQPSFEYNACKEEVMILNLDGQDDGLDDPCPTFDGKTLQNNKQYICYLNAVVNGLLSLKKFRELIEFMEPTMKDYFTSLLDDKMKDLEPLRKTLHEFNSNFPIGKHSDPCEALTQLILLTNVDNLHQKSLDCFYVQET